MSNMNLLVVILKHEDLVSEICKELVEEGIHGGTIVDGTGMASVVEKMDDLPIFGMLRSILADDDDHEVVKMMFFVVDDEEMKKARKTINDVIGSSIRRKSAMSNPLARCSSVAISSSTVLTDTDRQTLASMEVFCFHCSVATRSGISTTSRCASIRTAFSLKQPFFPPVASHKPSGIK